MVLLAVMLPALLGATALSVDIALFYFEWAVLQKAADAAALAGASQLPANPTQAISTASSYATTNGVTSAEITSVTVGATNQTVTVTLTRNVPYYFGRLVGLTQSPVMASATAGVVTSGAAFGMVPVGIDSRTTYTYGQPITLFQGNNPPGTWGPGNWGALSLGGSGADNFANNVINGYQGTVSVGDLITTETGQMTGPVKTSFDTRISMGEASDPSGTFSSHTLGDVRVATVPMVNFANINGNSQVPVVGFAEVWLTSVDNKLDINAVFIQQISQGGRPNAGATNYGAYHPVLMR